MNLIKRFMGNDNANVADDTFDDQDSIYYPGDVKFSDEAEEPDTSYLDSPERKDPEFHAADPEKVSLKLLQPKSHTEATRIADKLKDGCIVLLDISSLTKEQAHRLVDFLAGVAYVLGGEMIKTNKNTIVVSPSGVDISGFAPEEAAEEEEEASEEETYEEIEEVPEEIEEV